MRGGLGLDRPHPHRVHTAHNLHFLSLSLSLIFGLFLPPPTHPTPPPSCSNSAPWQHTCTHKVLSYIFLFLLFPIITHQPFHLQLLPSLFPPCWLSLSLSLSLPLSQTRRLEPLRVSVTSLTRSFPIDIPTFPLYISFTCTRRLFPPPPTIPLFSFHSRLPSRAAACRPRHDKALQTRKPSD